MEYDAIYLITAIVFFYIVWKGLQIKASDLSQKLKTLNYASHGLSGMFIISLLYTGFDVTFLILLTIVSAPFAVYSSYEFYKEDKMKLVSSYVMALLFVVVTWFFGFY